MAQIFGQIESLERLLDELNSRGINRFGSLQDIDVFKSNFQYEKNQIVTDHNQRLKLEIDELKNILSINQKKCEDLKNQAEIDLNRRINKFKLLIAITKNRINAGFLNNLFYSSKLWILEIRLKKLSNNYSKIVERSVNDVIIEIERDTKKLTELTEDTNEVLNERCLPELNRLEYIKSTLQDLYPLIAGAIGESLVVKEIEKLSDDVKLINNFSIKFNPPIFNRATGDRIYTIQIDHVLISKAGIFVLETKNWSNKSIESLDLRSPVDQIKRSSFAFYVMVNDAIKCGEIRLNHHPWGDKKVQIRNVIVMINEKPKDDFQFVKIKSLSELNRYITYFEDLLSETEVQSLTDYLLNV
jgi:hypothetical protein